MMPMRPLPSFVIALPLVAAAALSARALPQQPFEPRVGQHGKDVVWVPTPPELVEKMLDLAEVTQQDLVVDLGSGDGRNVIAAAKRGARARGVEFNPEMVELSRRLAAQAGVADRATFVEGDMFEASISDATVLALFLLPNNLEQLKEDFLALRPGTRIVLNTFAISGWEADASSHLNDACESWCTALLYIVPARVSGLWRLADGELRLEQHFQKVSGVVSSGGAQVPFSNGRLRGDRITFSAGGTEYEGRVTGNRIDGRRTSGGSRQDWTATR